MPRGNNADLYRGEAERLAGNGVERGRSEPMPICTRMMESSNADSEISSFMRRLPALSETVPVEKIPTETVSSEMVAS